MKFEFVYVVTYLYMLLKLSVDLIDLLYPETVPEHRMNLVSLAGLCEYETLAPLWGDECCKSMEIPWNPWNPLLNIVSIVSPCVGGCEIGRKKKTEICKIYLPVKWVNGISFLFFSFFFLILRSLDEK